MRNLSTKALILITAVLGLLLIVYVFIGSKSNRDDPGEQVRCSSREAFELVEAELFRRAAALRRTADPNFQKLAQYSIVRAGSKIVRDADQGSGTVACTGSIVLDLPPGVEVVGGRRSMEGKVEYVLAGGGGGALQLRGLSNADALIVPLAAVTTNGSASGQPLAVPARTEDLDVNGTQPQLGQAPPPRTQPPPLQPRPGLPRDQPSPLEQDRRFNPSGPQLRRSRRKNRKPSLFGKYRRWHSPRQGQPRLPNQQPRRPQWR